MCRAGVRRAGGRGGARRLHASAPRREAGRSELGLAGKVAFVAGVADAAGYGWAVARQLAEAGATVAVGTWPPAMPLLQRAMRKGAPFAIDKVYPLDAVFSAPDEVSEETRSSKRYAAFTDYDIQSCAAAVARDYGRIDILVHSLANGPQVDKPLLETNRARSADACTHARTRAREHARTYAHTHTQCLSLLSLSPLSSLSLSLSLSFTNARQSVCAWICTCMCTRALLRMRARVLACACAFACSCACSCACACRVHGLYVYACRHMRVYQLLHARARARASSLSLPLSLSLSLCVAHTHTHVRAHTHTWTVI